MIVWIDVKKFLFRVVFVPCSPGSKHFSQHRFSALESIVCYRDGRKKYTYPLRTHCAGAMAFSIRYQLVHLFDIYCKTNFISVLVILFHRNNIEIGALRFGFHLV